jgi:hypothetical protein
MIQETIEQIAERKERIKRRRQSIKTNMVMVNNQQLEIPKGVYLKNNSYYLVFKNKWYNLGKTIDMSEIARIKCEDNEGTFTGHLTKKFPAIKSGAKQRGLSFSITLDDIIKCAKRQGWRCAITRIPFTLKRRECLRILPYSPSVDRIDHMVGYEKENIRIVCASINIARSNLPDDIFLDLVVNAGINMASQLRSLRGLSIETQ